MIVGHEYVGVIEEVMLASILRMTLPIQMTRISQFYYAKVGREVRGIEVGQRVTGEGHITCGHCRNCRGGRTHLCRLPLRSNNQYLKNIGTDIRSRCDPVNMIFSRTHRATTGIGVNRPGSFAEYVALPAFNVFQLMDGISDEQVSFA